jgi:hypothetical protein
MNLYRNPKISASTTVIERVRVKMTRFNLTKRLLSVLAAGSLASATLLGVSVSGVSASAVSSGTVHIVSYGDGTGAGSAVILTGAIGDSGSGISVDANGTADPANGTEQQLTLLHGSFSVSTKALDKSINKAFNSFQPNTSTCSGIVTATGVAPVVSGSGTGAYSGISGSFTVTFTYATIGPKNTSGKHKGQCTQSNNAQPLGSAQLVTGSGTVSY